MKILFFDLINDGHHFFYNYNVMKIRSRDKKFYFTSNLINIESKKLLNDGQVTVIESNSSNNLNLLSRNIYILKNLIKLKKYIKNVGIDIIAFLYLDNMILPLFFMRSFWKNNLNILATLHWFPNRPIKIKLLKKMCDNGLNIVVHTEFIKEQLKKVGITNVYTIYYPILKKSNFTKVEANKKLDINQDENNKTILYFGGTRYDKGLDILLDSMEKVKSKINVIIAGQEQTFKKDYIQEKVSKLADKNIFTNLHFIDDEEVELYFKISDIVVLPYRKMFNGESGILTEAINNKNIVIVPNIIHFPDIVQKYFNGVVYEAESIDDLAKKIDYTIENFNVFNEGVEKAYNDYTDKHSIDNFIRNYESVIYDRK